MLNYLVLCAFIYILRVCVGAVLMNETVEPAPVQLDEILVPLG